MHLLAHVPNFRGTRPVGYAYDVTHTSHTQTAETFSKAKTYEGEFKHGKFHGKGTAKYASGFEYRGEWKNGLPNGTGWSTCKGVEYYGNWFHGQPHGTGKKTLQCGSTYEGEWRDGVPHGQGEEMSSAGDVYVGEWARGRYHGHGRFTCHDGSTFDGSWYSGVPDGDGKAITPGGIVIQGRWRYGRLHGRGRVLRSENDYYEGQWENGATVGTYTCCVNGMSFDGRWVNGVMIDFQIARAAADQSMAELLERERNAGMPSHVQKNKRRRKRNKKVGTLEQHVSSAINDKSDESIGNVDVLNAVDDLRCALHDSTSSEAMSSHDNACTICMNGQSCFACVPCGHCCLCQKCAGSLVLDQCPICREGIESLFRIYFS